MALPWPHRSRTVECNRVYLPGLGTLPHWDWRMLLHSIAGIAERYFTQLLTKIGELSHSLVGIVKRNATAGTVLTRLLTGIG